MKWWCGIVVDRPVSESSVLMFGVGSGGGVIFERIVGRAFLRFWLKGKPLSLVDVLSWLCAFGGSQFWCSDLSAVESFRLEILLLWNIMQIVIS